MAGRTTRMNLPARWSVGTLRTLVNEAPISPSDDSLNEVLRYPSNRPTFAKMGLAIVAGATILGLLGWAAARSTAAPADLGYDLMATSEGTITQVIAQPGQTVKKGDLLVLLDDTAEQQALTTARAELDLLAQEVQGAGIAVAMPPGSGLGGKIIQTGPMPRGVVPTGKVPEALGTLPPVTETDQPAAPKTDIKAAAEADLKAVEAKLEAQRTLRIETVQKRDDALALAAEATRNAETSKVIAEQRKKQAEKMKFLLSEGAVSRVEAAKAESLYQSAQGGADAALRQAEEHQASATSLDAEVAAIDIRIAGLERDVAKAKDLVAKAPASVPAAPVAAQPANPLPAAEPSPGKPAFVRSTPAPSIPAKVEVDKGVKREVEEKLTAAKRKVDEAETNLESRRIVAPRDGVILKVLVRAGGSLRKGQSILEIRFADQNPSK